MNIYMQKNKKFLSTRIFRLNFKNTIIVYHIISNVDIVQIFKSVENSTKRTFFSLSVFILTVQLYFVSFSSSTFNLINNRQ
jgi:hypothetical protein